MILDSQVTISADIDIWVTEWPQSKLFAIRVLASLIMLGNILDDGSFALASLDWCTETETS